MFTSSQLRQAAITTVYKATKVASDETAKKRLVKIASCLAAGKTIKEAIAATGITGDAAVALAAKLASSAVKDIQSTVKQARRPLRRAIGNMRDRRAARQGGGMQMQAPQPAAPAPAPAAAMTAPKPAAPPSVAAPKPVAPPTAPSPQQNQIQSDMESWLASDSQNQTQKDLSAWLDSDSAGQPKQPAVATSQPRPRPQVNTIDGGQFADAHPLAAVGANARQSASLPNHDASIVPSIISQPMSRAYDNTVNAGSQAVQGIGAAVNPANVAGPAARAAGVSGSGLQSALLPSGAGLQDLVPPVLSKLWQ